MKLIQRYGGIGHFELDQKERKAMLDLADITSYPKNDALRCRNYRGQYNEQRAVFFSSMETLFPFSQIDKSKDTYEVYGSPQSNTMWYNDQPVVGVRRIPSRLPIARSHQDRSVQLEILFPKDHSTQEGHYFAYVQLASDYKPDAVDDLAAKLGEPHNLTIARPLHYEGHGGEKIRVGYSLADVHRLSEIVQIYNTAAKRIQEPPTTLNVTEKELNTLRHDAREHENVFTRRGSAQLYNEILEQLARL